MTPCDTPSPFTRARERRPSCRLKDISLAVFPSLPLSFPSYLSTRAFPTTYKILQLCAFSLLPHSPFWLSSQGESPLLVITWRISISVREERAKLTRWPTRPNLVFSQRTSFLSDWLHFNEWRSKSVRVGTLLPHPFLCLQWLVQSLAHNDYSIIICWINGYMKWNTKKRTVPSCGPGPPSLAPEPLWGLGQLSAFTYIWLRNGPSWKRG